MFESGKANTLLEVQNASDGVDALGAPEFGWVSQVPALLLFAYPENETTAVDSLASGPREESVRTLTFVTRNHPGLVINTRQRLVDMATSELYRVNAIRYDAKKTMCYIDVVTGESSG